MPHPLLLIYVHPAPHASRVNKALVQAARALPEVEVHDLYGRWPEFFIDVREEQQRLLRHDRIVIQHPLYWYSVPPLFKEWLDSVLGYGWAYGPGGEALQGKRWCHAISTGGQDSAYTPSGANRFSMEELLRPLEATAWRCGMVWQPPFLVHGARALTEENLREQAIRYQTWLEGLQRDPQSR